MERRRIAQTRVHPTGLRLAIHDARHRVQGFIGNVRVNSACYWG